MLYINQHVRFSFITLAIDTHLILLATKHKDVCHCQICEKGRKKANNVKSSSIKKLLTSPKYVDSYWWCHLAHFLHYRFLFLVIGWVGVVLLAMQVANAEVKSVTWDPYEVMGLKEVNGIRRKRKEWNSFLYV